MSFGARRGGGSGQKNPPPPSLPAKCLSADLSRLKVATYTSHGEKEGEECFAAGNEKTGAPVVGIKCRQPSG